MSTETLTRTGQYTLDVSHTRLGFTARHAMVTKVRGAFNEFEGTTKIDGANPENSSVSITIQVASIDTRNEQRDGHLRTNDFLDVYPDWTLEASMERITQIVDETGIEHVVLSAIAPNDHRRETTEEFNAALEELAADEGWTWVDPWPFVRASNGAFVPGVSADGIHPTKQVEMRVGVTLRGVIFDSAHERLGR